VVTTSPSPASETAFAQVSPQPRVHSHVRDHDQAEAYALGLCPGQRCIDWAEILRHCVLPAVSRDGLDENANGVATGDRIEPGWREGGAGPGLFESVMVVPIVRLHTPGRLASPAKEIGF
jgi:hypothetical protein